MAQQILETTNTQIVNAQFAYSYGGLLSKASNTQLTCGGGQFRDSTNTYDIFIPAGTTPPPGFNPGPLLTVSSQFVGAGGLDAGTVQPNTMYVIYVLYDSTNSLTPALLMSTSYNAPILPSVNGVTYSAFRDIGFWLTDGSGNFVNAFTYDFGSLRYFQYDLPVRVLNNGNASSANVSLVGAVPINRRSRVNIQATFAPPAAGQNATIRPTGNVNPLYTIQGIVTGVAQTSLVQILPAQLAGVPSITYGLSSTASPAALTLDVLGFEFFV